MWSLGENQLNFTVFNMQNDVTLWGFLRVCLVGVFVCLVCLFRVFLLGIWICTSINVLILKLTFLIVKFNRKSDFLSACLTFDLALWSSKSNVAGSLCA